MDTSGLVLDVYDDFHGSIVREIFPTVGDIPENVKTAQVLTPEDRERLPDGAFALVLLNEGEKLRKYACTDAGNTTLSVAYFLKNAHKLPSEAQKTAAANLSTACRWYNLEAPEQLQKIAIGIGTMLTAIPALSVAGSVPGQISQRLSENRALGGDGRIVTGDERASLHQMMGKQADISGTDEMPITAPSTKTPAMGKTTILKSADGDPDGEKAAAAMHRLVTGSTGDHDVEPDTNIGTEHKKAPPAEPQAKVMRPHVDVSGKSAPHMVKEKKAERFALTSVQKYPLDSYAHVQLAAQYFDKHASAFTPDERREFGVNLVKRASELGIPVSNEARQYGSNIWASDEKTAFGKSMRLQACGDIADLAGTLELLYEKKAEIDPELFAATLGEFDKVAGITHLYDKSIPDPYASVFGEKVAEEWSELIGNDYVTEQDLRRLAKIGMRALKSTFDTDFAAEFRKDPVSIFKSLPLDQKRIVMRMANDNSGPGIELTG